ncbi:MAG: RNA-binding protein [Candidatus Diapherotrites archaeon]|nr:RNA-binding protein [Candidatus Diapherotrites archaeon]
MREIVIPGEELSNEKDVKPGFGTYRDADVIRSSVFGVVEKINNTIRVVPLRGKYIPITGDYVIGIVTVVKFRGCFVDINSPYIGFLPTMREDEYRIGDLLLLKIVDVDEVYNVTLNDPKRLYDGKLIEVIPVKIPRIVGKRASMLDILRKGTNCKIFVGRNGRIFIKGTPDEVKKAEKAIRLIEREAHTTGLTDRVKAFLEGKIKESGNNGNEK